MANNYGMLPNQNMASGAKNNIELADMENDYNYRAQ